MVAVKTVIFIFSNFIGNIRTKTVNPMALVSAVFKFLNACQLRDEQ
jgi:hypothetical protein